MSDVPTSYDEVDVDKLTEQIVTAIQRPQQADRDDDDPGGYMNAGVLPGFGEPDGCGEETVPYYCTGCGAVAPIPRTCYRSSCPRCAPMWDVERSAPNLARLQTVAKTMSGRLGGTSVKKHHVVLSPPPTQWYLTASNPVERTFEVVKEILDLFNAEGIVAYHGYRGTDGDDQGAWKERLFNDRDWEKVRSELRPNGHFHCIIASPFIAGGEVTKQVEEETGWIIDRVRGLDTIESAAESLTYALSHTSLFEKNGQMLAQYRRFGSTWHDDRVNVYDHVERDAERAVRSVAPRVLGVAPSALRCEATVPEGEEAEEQIDRGAAYEPSGDTDGSSASSGGCEHDHSDDGATTCKGAIKPIWEANDLLEDDDWCEQAHFSDQLKKKYQEWQQTPGLDRPPPIAAEWSETA